MLTEHDASLKRCCGPGDCGSPGNPNENGYRDRYCLGSGCMAWLWLPGKPFWTGSGVSRTQHHEPPTHGYCGLVGRAE